MSAFAIQVRELRKKRGMTQRELTDALDIRRGTYGHYELGKREPTYDTLIRFAD